MSRGGQLRARAQGALSSEILWRSGVLEKSPVDVRYFLYTTTVGVWELQGPLGFGLGMWEESVRMKGQIGIR